MAEDVTLALGVLPHNLPKLLAALPNFNLKFPFRFDLDDYDNSTLATMMDEYALSKGLSLSAKARQMMPELISQYVSHSQNGNETNMHIIKVMILKAIMQQSIRLQYTDTDAAVLELVPTDFLTEQEQVALPSAAELLANLDTFVGQEKIKNFIRSLHAVSVIEQLRMNTGDYELPARQTMHMIFTGSPGTGKTSFARLIGKLLKSIGVIQRGQLVEARRSDLVGAFLVFHNHGPLAVLVTS